MALITVTCPVCGGQAQIEKMRGAMCPYCGSELRVPQENQGAALAAQPDMQMMQDMQFAEADKQFAQQQELMQQSMQFAPPPMPQQNMYAAPQMNPAQFAAPVQQRYYSEAELRAARKRCNQWRLLNLGMIAAQTLVMAFGIALVDYFYEDGLGGLMVIAWLFSLPVCGVLSGAVRPDDAYIDQKPLFKKKWVQSIMHFLLSIPASAAAGGILYAILRFIVDEL